MLTIMFISTYAISACGESAAEDNSAQPVLPENPSQPGDGQDDGDRPDGGGNSSDDTATSLNISLIVGNNALSVTMEDNAAARDFISRLPLEVTLNDFNNTTEKIFYPEPPLTLDGVKQGCAPQPGDITIYAPWGNVAIFCKPWSYSDDLVKIGHIDGDGINMLQVAGDIGVRFEVAK